MKKYLSMLLCTLAAVSCTHREAEVQHAFIQPLLTAQTVTDLNAYVQNATVPARFTTSDFDWMAGQLPLTVYSEDFYDTVALHQMAVGDTLLFGGDTIVVRTIEGDSYLTINGGIEEGGADLMACDEGGTYRGVLMDDHSTYTELGSVQLPLSENFTFIDCRINPTDPSDTIRTDQKLYLENLKDYKTEFYSIDTRVQVEDGVITNITRHWIP